MKAVLTFLLMLWCFVSLAHAQEQTAEADRIADMVTALEADDTHFAPVMIDPQRLDEQGQASQRRAFQAYYDYRSEGFDHRRRVFAWQLLSSKIIFLLVVSLVAAGIYFSWLQFRQGLKGDAGGDTRTTLEATPGGIKLSSPVLGVIILTLSLLFFYLYLVYVYPIEEIL
jgi:hypothetical protein